MRKIFLTACLFICIHVIAQNGSELMNVTDMLNIKTVSGITINNDGTKAAFTVNSIEPLENDKLDYRYTSQIFIQTLDGAAPHQITFAKERAAQPTWSPDGKLLAFVRVADGKPQIFILPMNGGEAWQLTHFTYGASNPKWSPDGQKIIFSASIPFRQLLKDSVLNPRHAGPVWPFEKPGFEKNEEFKTSKVKANPNGDLEEIRAYLLNDEIDGKARVLNKLNFQDEMGVTSEMSFNHFFSITVSPDATPKEITHGFYRYNDVEFTPDGKNLIISGNIDSTQHPDRALENEIFMSDVDGNNLHLLLGQKGMVYNSAKISPSGKWLAFQFDTTSFVSISTLAIMPLNGNPMNMITIPLDRSKSNLVWSKDEKYIYLLAQSNGGVPLYRVDLATKKIEQLSDYNSGISSYDISNKKIVFAKNDVANPSEIFIADVNLKNQKQTSSLNEWVKNKKISFPEKHSFINDKGMTIEYWVMKPTNYQQGKKYPLLLEIHGGPSAMWGPGESSMWHEFQYFSSRGYGVVYSNPRGSGGYGLEFLRGNIKDWGTGPTSDVLTALDKTVAEGWADTSQLLVTGGSYAGYLVAWIIGHDHRFKAACSQRGVYDLATFFGEGNAWRLVPNYFGGYPWQPEVKTILQRESPITYVQNITTPYIIFHGDNDRRTGFVQGEMMFRSLKVLGRPVEYVRHPGATHEITRSGDNRERIDQMLRTYEFFERWLKK